jgi:SAM-dependent methyltransferase
MRSARPPIGRLCQAGGMHREDWDRRYAESGLLWSAQPNRFLVAEVSDLPPGRALDLACGEGRNAVWLARLGWQVTGVDFSEVAIAKAREQSRAAGVDVEWVVADLVDYSPPERAFELVIAFYLQVTAGDRARILPAAAESVAEGGTFLLVGHDSRNIADGYGGPQDPAVLYTPDDVVADLPGLEVERAALVERPVETPDGVRVALDALVRAHR